ncbi:MAG: hypothetical protein V1780_01375 [Chloroflexota bacterium]
MTDKPEKAAQKSCMICQATSQEKVLLCAEDHNREVWVCTQCLPRLIHGSH